MGIPVTYYSVDLYLSTLVHLESLQLEHLHTGHWPSMHGEEIRDFFSDSRKTVQILDRKIMSKLNHARAGLPLNELMDAAMEEFPDWPGSTRELTAFAVKGHLDRLESGGHVVIDHQASPPRWKVV